MKESPLFEKFKNLQIICTNIVRYENELLITVMIRKNTILKRYIVVVITCFSLLFQMSDRDGCILDDHIHIKFSSTCQQKLFILFAKIAFFNSLYFY